ncbi:hypothetical protein [Cohaesibacter marisflavi]|uniref:hypothetical protein n=1 Tax=Cohaesibacter marisflavi TaxID=655353 RepID=UPI0029C694AD|nr:hypothetical protein [Cohaesibacter marisflavi]
MGNLNARSGAHLKRLAMAQSVQSAIDLLIEARAEERGVGKCDFLENLTEVDASHWNKIVNGKATLTLNKFKLLTQRLCVTEEEEYIILQHYEKNRNSIKENRFRKKSFNNMSRSQIENTFFASGVSLKDLCDYNCCFNYISNTIEFERKKGSFLTARKLILAVLLSLKRKYITLPDSVMEDIVTELLSNYAYIGHIQADHLLFKDALGELEKPFWKQWDKGGLSALRLHLYRRFFDEFLGVDKEKIYKYQLKAYKILKSSDVNEMRYHQVIVNKNKMDIDIGFKKIEDQEKLKRTLFIRDKVNYTDEELAIVSNIYAIYLIRQGRLDDANVVLARAITELDKNLGKFSWGRANIRERQGVCALTEFELTGNINLAESALGYFDDALQLSRRLGNTIFEDRIFHARMQILAKSGISADVAG